MENVFYYFRRKYDLESKVITYFFHISGQDQNPDGLMGLVDNVMVAALRHIGSKLTKQKGEKLWEFGKSNINFQSKCKYIKDNSCAIVYEDEDCGRGDGIILFNVN